MSRFEEALAHHPERAALASSVIDLSLMLAKLLVGLLIGSLALISDAVHSALDLTASLLLYLAVRAARLPPDQEHPYGHGRAENLAAYTTGMLLVLAAIGIAFEAVQRFRNPALVDAAPYAVGFLLGALFLEVARTVIFRRLARVTGSPALQALGTDKAADLLSVAAVLVGLTAVRAGLQQADGAAALVVATLIFWAAIRLLRQAGAVLMDRAAVAASRQVMEAAGSVAGVREVRSARVRQAGSELIGEVEVTGRPTLSLEGAAGLADQVKKAVADRVSNVDLSVVVGSGADPSRFVERVHAVAARNGNFRDLHDVVVEREADNSLHVSLHAKLPESLSMREVSQLTAGFEQELRSELPEIARVDIHLEPLEADLIQGRDVTHRHPELIERIRALAERQPGVVGGRDIELSSRRGAITAHVAVQVADDLTLEQAHRIETELEDSIKRAEPGVQPIVRAGV